MLTNDPLKKIAETVGVSHGFVLVWRTKEEFRDKIAELESEFVETLSKCVKEFRRMTLDEFRDISKLSDSLLLNVFDSISALEDNNYSWIRGFLEIDVKRKPRGAIVKFIKKLRPILLIFLPVFLSDRPFHPSTEYAIVLFRALCLHDLQIKISQSAGLSFEDFHLFRSFWTKLMIIESTKSALHLSNTVEANLSQLYAISDHIGKTFPHIPDKEILFKKLSEASWTLDLNERVQKIFAEKGNPWRWLKG